MKRTLITLLACSSFYAHAAEQPSAWKYKETTDPLGGGISKKALLISTNTFELNFPFNGKQKAALAIRKNERSGNAVMLLIQRGQFVCNPMDCELDISIDGGKPITIHGEEPADYSKTTILFQNYDKAIEILKNAKRIVIGATIYQNGMPAFEFDVSGLEWD